MDVNHSLDVNLDICLVIQGENLASGTGNLNWIAKLRGYRNPFFPGEESDERHPQYSISNDFPLAVKTTSGNTLLCIRKTSPIPRTEDILQTKVRLKAKQR